MHLLRDGQRFKLLNLSISGKKKLVDTNSAFVSVEVGQMTSYTRNEPTSEQDKRYFFLYVQQTMASQVFRDSQQSASPQLSVTLDEVEYAALHFQPD